MDLANRIANSSCIHPSVALSLMAAFVLVSLVSVLNLLAGIILVGIIILITRIKE